MTQAEIINRIEAESKLYEDKNPYDAIHSAYYMGAKSWRNKTIEELSEIVFDFETGLLNDKYHGMTLRQIFSSLKVDL